MQVYVLRHSLQKRRQKAAWLIIMVVEMRLQLSTYLVSENKGDFKDSLFLRLLRARPAQR